MQSELVTIENIKQHFDRVYVVLDDYLSKLDISRKNALRFTLLAEEAVRLAKSLVEKDARINLWFEGNSRLSFICIELETNRMDENKKEQFISISSSGENAAEPTFFDTLKALFVKPKSPTWSLAEYQADILMKRKEDKYSEDAWDNLERSVLANLATDISVEITGNNVLMMIQKDFTESLVKVNSKKPVISSSQIFLSSKDKNFEGTLAKVNSCAGQLDLSKKDSLHLKLIMEETIGMIKAMTGDFTAAIWAEKHDGSCAVKLLANTRMDIDKKNELISASANKKNALAKGFMGKISDIIETESLIFDDVNKYQIELGNMGMYYGSMGAYGTTGMSGTPFMNSFRWSLNDYKNNLNETKDDDEAHLEAWDELEKSIVANIAKDVIVGVKKNFVEMTIIMDIKEG